MPHRRTGFVALPSLVALVGAAGGLVLAACGGSGGGADTAGAQAPRGLAGAPERVLPVETAQVKLGEASRAITVSGTVAPIRTIGVNSRMAGALTAVNVEEGDVVRTGQVIARMDDREVRAEVARAEAELQLARSAFERAEELRKEQVVTAAEFERDRAAYEAARAELEQLRTRLDYASIEAPITGVVTEKRVEEGDVVAPQSRLFAIADISTLVVQVPVSELDVAGLREGQAVTLALDAVPGRTFGGRIRRIFPTADTASRLVPVEIALGPEAERIARPGFLARVQLALEARDSVLVIPAAAVLDDATGSSVFVVEEGRAVRRPVRAGLTMNGRVEITSGLARGETVVVAGATRIRDGAPVRAVPAPLADTAVVRTESRGSAPAPQEERE